MSPEQHARQAIERLLSQAGWKVMDVSQADVHAGRGVALREFPLQGGLDFDADDSRPATVPRVWRGNFGYGNEFGQSLACDRAGATIGSFMTSFPVTHSHITAKLPGPS